MRVSNNTEWLFFHLWKKNPDTMMPCLNLNIAETIIFRWAQPYFWYYTAKDGMIVRKTKEKILLQNIEESYLNNVPKCDTIANTLTSSEDPSLKLQEKIEFEYIQKTDFHDFLFQREKPHNVIIQKFIEPKNGQNALIKVAWTPQFCLFFRKTNINDINNSKIPLMNRLVTFEGSEHLSNSDSISSPILASELEQTCLNIVKHVHSVTSGNVQISKMVLYFKLDDKNRLWLLFCTGLKLREKLQNPHSGGAFRKKGERPLSPIMALTVRKEKDSQKHKVPAHYLLEDQINEVDDHVCLRCSREDLLYDLKLKHVLEHEEKIIKGLRPKDLEQIDEIDNDESAPFFGVLMSPERGKGNVPSIMKKLYPTLTEERYLKLKKNVSLMNMTVKLCESCYLVITENFLDNAEEKNARKFQTNLKEIVKKDTDAFGFSAYSKSKRSQPGFEKAVKVVSHQIKGLIDQENYNITSENELSKNFSKTELLSREDSKPYMRPYKTSAFSQQPDSRQVYTKSAYQNKREHLPEIGIPQEEEGFRPYKTDTVKDYYSRTPKGDINNRNKVITPQQPRQLRSPYSSEQLVNLPLKDLKENKPTDIAKNFKIPRPPKEKASESPISTLWKSNRVQRVHRTNYSSMLNTIQDLKCVLEQIEDF